MAILLLALGGLVACAASGPATPSVEDGLHAASASVRTQAIARVAARGERRWIPRLIDLLDDPDPGVRMAAHGALRSLTGRETGYRPWAGSVERRQAVEAWRRWWAGSGEAAGEVAAGSDG